MQTGIPFYGAKANSMFAPELQKIVFDEAWDKIEQHFGLIVKAKGVAPGGGAAISFREFVQDIAREAMLLIGDTSYPYWNNDVSRDIRVWQLAVWRYCLVFPLGFVCSDHQLITSGKRESWSPFAGPVSEFMKGERLHVGKSNRTVSATAIGGWLYVRFFQLPSTESGAYVRSNGSGMVDLAVADAFSDMPNPDNPVFAAYKRALKKYFKSGGAPALPYFVASAVSHLAKADEELGRLYAGTGEQVFGGASLPRGDEKSNAKASVIAAAFVPAQEPGTDTTALPTIVERYLAALGSMVNSHNVTVNGKGALIQVTNRGVALLMPAAALVVDSDQWSGPTLDASELEQALTDCFVAGGDGGKIHIASIIPPGSVKAVGKMKLGLLPPALVSEYLPATVSHPVNTDLCML